MLNADAKSPIPGKVEHIVATSQREISIVAPRNRQASAEMLSFSLHCPNDSRIVCHPIRPLMDTLSQPPREQLANRWHRADAERDRLRSASAPMNPSDSTLPTSPAKAHGLRKDKALVGLADRGCNVAQFVSFAPTDLTGRLRIGLIERISQD